MSIKTRFVDGADVSFNANLVVESERNQTHVRFQPSLEAGTHEFRCLVTDPRTHKTTIAQRAFQVMPLSSEPSGNEVSVYRSLSHEQIKQSLPSTFYPMNVSYALEYPTSSAVKMITHVDWSKAMMVLNPLILLIIVLVYWGCRKIGFHILHKQTTKLIAHHIDFSSWDWFFVSDRNMKLSLFNDYFTHWPSWLRWVCARLFLFTSDNLIFYGVLAAIVCRNFLPRLYVDEQVEFLYTSEL